MNAQQTYQQNSVNTATPAELTLMLYKGGVRFINAAKRALEEGNVQDSHKYNVKAQEIVSELIITLNTEYAISNNLLSMYDYMRIRLIEANVKKDVVILDEIKGYFEEFAITWAEAMKSVKK
ncbi:flagellar export chaperone FliS [Aneurinibacillus tyrosinisolvens]|uniref:flagellar export chaperone FliS n=1 Tax=Aneurinibacillus tyrosinisolvens TaxID=1443435 RepID=UPI00063F6590|nr:flagellar export chaperone FliS [Aneurinibacillus tyrosinisolvens]